MKWVHIHYSAPFL